MVINPRQTGMFNRLRESKSFALNATVLLISLFSVMFMACTQPAGPPPPTFDIPASISAAVAQSMPTQIVEPTPDVDATIEVGVRVAQEATATQIAKTSPPSNEEASAAQTETTQTGETVVATATPVVAATATPHPYTEVHFAGASYTTNKPNQIQVTFALRNQNGRAIVVPAHRVEESLKLYEREVSRNPGDWKEIDYSETTYFVHTAENIDLEVVFVLDFTNSMYKERLPNGQNGIEAMLEAFDKAIDVFSSTHRIGVVEFHDKNFDPKVLSRLTSDRKEIRGRIKEFTDSQFDNGTTRLWDAVGNGLELYTNQRRTVRALIFLTDGVETSSKNWDIGSVQNRAIGEKVQMYVLGIGVKAEEKGELQTIARKTKGAYHDVSDISELQSSLETVVSDLRGQYQLSYTTAKTTGRFETQIEVALNGLKDTLDVGPYVVDEFDGNTNAGVISVDPPSPGASEGTTAYFVRARHVPQNVDTIRFKISDHESPVVELVPQSEGGLLGGWKLKDQDESGFFEATSTEPVEFGNFGLMFEITVSQPAGVGQTLELEFDNSIYGIEGKGLFVERTP